MLCLFVVLLALLSSSYSCDVDSVTVGLAATPSSMNANAYNVKGVTDHFSYTRLFEYHSDISTTFACVDARRDSPLFGTPGGDFCELVVAMKAYFDQRNIAPTEAAIGNIFNKFMDEIASAERPFYYHTDSGRMNQFFQALSSTYNINATIFPDSAPAQSAVWLSEYVKPQYQGCGHLRLMIQSPSDYGLPDAFIPQTLLKQFVSYYWSASDANKQKIEFSVKLGTLEGKAVVIVNNTGPGCSGYSPKYSTNLKGSSLFIFHAGAVGNLREKVLAPLFKRFDAAVNEADLVTRMNNLFGTQLGATLTYLAPANAVGIFTVDVATSGNPPPVVEDSICEASTTLASLLLIAIVLLLQ